MDDEDDENDEDGGNQGIGSALILLLVSIPFLIIIAIFIVWLLS